MKPVIIIAIAFVLLLIPTSLAFASIDTTIRFDSIHWTYDIGEEMSVKGKLIDAENRSVSFVEVQVWEDEDLLFFDGSQLLAKAQTDARGEFWIRVTVEDWDKDGSGEIYIFFEGNEKHNPSSSETKTITIEPGRIPIGKEFEAEEIREQQRLEKEIGIFQELQEEAKDIIQNIPVAEKQVEELIESLPSDGGCLIATATYGSELASQVQQLRELRDNSLLQTESGSAFMTGFNDFYYSFSPVIADYERENPVFKEMVKIAITPMISSLSILNYVNMDSEAEVLGYGISLILLNIGMYVGVPAAVIVGIRKRF